MKYSIYTEIIIHAPLEEVTKAFFNFSAYEKWNPFITIDAKDKIVGERIKVDFLENGKTKMTIQPTLLVNDHDTGYKWLGHLYVKGLFDGQHEFLWQRMDKDRTRFIQRESFSGLLVRPLVKSVLEPTELQFKEMNEALKTYIEAGKASGQ